MTAKQEYAKGFIMKCAQRSFDPNTLQYSMPAPALGRNESAARGVGHVAGGIAGAAQAAVKGINNFGYNHGIGKRP